MAANTFVPYSLPDNGAEKEAATVMVLDGDLIFEDIEAFSLELNALLDEDTRHVIVDMGSTRYISAKAIGVIASSLKKFRERKKDLKLVNVSEPIRNIFSITGISRTIGIYKDEHSMRASLGPQVGTLEKKSLW